MKVACCIEWWQTDHHYDTEIDPHEYQETYKQDKEMKINCSKDN